MLVQLHGSQHQQCYLRDEYGHEKESEGERAVKGSLRGYNCKRHGEKNGAKRKRKLHTRKILPVRSRRLMN